MQHVNEFTLWSVEVQGYNLGVGQRQPTRKMDTFHTQHRALSVPYYHL
jgi:hypothetical protein